MGTAVDRFEVCAWNSAHMTAALIISLRESFETALIVCVMLAFLKRTENTPYNRWVWGGLLAGIIFSVVLSVFLNSLLHNVTQAWRMYMEAGMMMLAAVFVGWMTIWMAQKSRTLKKDIEQEMSTHLQAGRAFSIFLMSFLSTAREGAEMVIMIQATILSGVQVLHALSGVLAGILGAALLGWIFLKGMKKISLPYFFAATGIVLLLLGTGLSVRGVGLLSYKTIVASHEEETLLEEVFEVLLGTSIIPTPLQASAGLLYASIVGALWMRTQRKQSNALQG